MIQASLQKKVPRFIYVFKLILPIIDSFVECLLMNFLPTVIGFPTKREIIQIGQNKENTLKYE